MLTQMAANCRHSIAYDTRYGTFKPDKVDFSVQIQSGGNGGIPMPKHGNKTQHLF